MSQYSASNINQQPLYYNNMLNSTIFQKSEKYYDGCVEELSSSHSRTNIEEIIEMYRNCSRPSVNASLPPQEVGCIILCTYNASLPPQEVGCLILATYNAVQRYTLIRHSILMY